MGYKNLKINLKETFLPFPQIVLREIRGSNFVNSQRFAKVLLLAAIVLFYVDYQNYVSGLWLLKSGYRLLFYSHIALAVGMLIVIGTGWTSQTRDHDEKSPSNFPSIFFSVFSLFLCAVISGYVDQLIHGQITVYILGSFLIAAVIYLRPLTSLIMYSSSYIVFLYFVTKYQTDPNVLKGHYINSSLLVILACFFSIVLSRAKMVDILNSQTLTIKVKERTKELEDANNSLVLRISEKKEAFEKIRQLAAIVESSIDGIIGINSKGLVTSWNKGAEQVYGYSEAEIINKSIGILSPPEHQLEANDFLSVLNKGEKIECLETVRIRKDGKKVWVSLTISPVLDGEGNIIGASSIVRDITERKEMEQELARFDQLNLIGEMSASISHEVRNPMTTVRGFLQMLGEKPECRCFQDYFNIMIEELDRANAILTEFLLLGKNAPTILKSQNINQLVQSLLPLIRVDAIARDQIVNFEMTEVPNIFLSDKEIRQVLLNLARNGLEAMSAGGYLTIRTYMEESKVVLSVRDQGKGIDPSVLSRLGKPFVTTKETGTGLGLAVCYSIAARHNASLSVDTGPTGTTFSLKFPMESPKANKENSVSKVS